MAASEKQYEQVISVLLSGSGFHGRVSLEYLHPVVELAGLRWTQKEPNIDVNASNGGGDNAIELAERHCGLESMISCRDSRLF